MCDPVQDRHDLDLADSLQRADLGVTGQPGRDAGLR